MLNRLEVLWVYGCFDGMRIIEQRLSDIPKACGFLAPRMEDVKADGSHAWRLVAVRKTIIMS